MKERQFSESCEEIRHEAPLAKKWTRYHASYQFSIVLPLLSEMPNNKLINKSTWCSKLVRRQKSRGFPNAIESKPINPHVGYLLIRFQFITPDCTHIWVWIQRTSLKWLDECMERLVLHLAYFIWTWCLTLIHQRTWGW